MQSKIQDGGFGVGFLFSAAANSTQRPPARSLNPPLTLTFDQTSLQLNFNTNINVISSPKLDEE